MKNYSKKTKKSQGISLSELHKDCVNGSSCVSSTCYRSARVKVILPKQSVESLDCDKCKLFEVYGTNGEQEKLPDFLVYLFLPITEPRFCFVEFKEQPATRAIKQIEKGIEVLKNNHEYFSVDPKPKKFECVIARNRKKGTAHAAQLAVILSHVFSFEGHHFTLRPVNLGDRLFPNIDNSYY